jgi:hypothetical protein
MRRYCKLVGVSVAFLLLVSLTASAGPIKSFSVGALSGISAGGGSGSLDSSTFTGKFSNVPRSLDGNSMFQGAKVSSGLMSGYSTSGGSFSGVVFSSDSDGGFSDENRRHGCGKRKNCYPVPEGGAQLTYVMFSAIAVFCGILISGKQRRTTRSAESA